MLSQFRPYIVKALQKTKLNKVAHEIYYNHVHGFNAAIQDTVPAVERVILKAKETGVAAQGDYFEFGIFKGYTFWHAQNFADTQGLNTMKFFGFDSFAGLPEVSGIDKTSNNDFYQGQYNCGKEQVVQNLESKGIDWNRTFLIEGYFDQSLNDEARDAHPMEKIAVALIDCDLYQSTVDVLNFLQDMMMDGTILMFDDWSCFDGDNEKGQRKAFAEFLQQQPTWQPEEWFTYGPYGQVFIMHAKAS